VFEVVAGVPRRLLVLTPSSSLEPVGIEARLGPQTCSKAAAPYLDAPATDPVYVRQELSLLTAFPNVPRIEVPAATASKGPRLFELRTYESHNERAHRAKVRMFAEMGEVDIFRKVGLTPVFFGRTFVGPAHAELYLHARARKHGRAREELGRLRDEPDWKSCRRLRDTRTRDRLEHHDRLPAPGGVFADLSPTSPSRAASPS
jgi:hypothetical protein